MKSRLLLVITAVCLFVGPIRADDEVIITPDIVYGHKFGLALTMDAFQPPRDANGVGVMFMVSGGWYSRWQQPEQSRKLFEPLLDKGFTVFAVRHGSSPKFDIPEAVADVRRSVRFVRANAKRFGIDADRIGVFGGSAGGHLSLMLGTASSPGDPDAKDPLDRVSDRVAAVVAYFPPTDIRPWVTDPKSKYYTNYPALRFDTKQAGDYSPLLQVSKDDAPTLLIHGDKDKLVPISHSERILAEFNEKKVPSELIVIEGAAHGFQGDDNRRAQEALIQWFEKYLAK